MNIVLAAINAKYIHSNLAVYSLRAYAKEYYDQITIAEYTINQQTDEILRDLYRRKPDILCFSCYIWNITYIEMLLYDLKKILPDTRIWLGGPEVSYDAEQVLKRWPEAELVMKGEGEATFAELLACEAGGTEISGRVSQVAGITYCDSSGELIDTGWRQVLDLSDVPFVYEQLEEFEHKIIYYESSRGCPFSCSYCLSSIDKRLRFRDIGLVKRELGHFIDSRVRQVKFVDRTFNCNHKHSMAIWSFIKEHDNGITNFHFEIAADLLTEEEIALIRTMRPGLIQLEIGVQSTNTRTIDEIHRTMKFEQVAEVVREIEAGNNVHQHLDLIAGLPYEDYDSFGRSFNQVYGLRPEQLQLGFLKVLKGSDMERQQTDYGLVHKTSPPYEVLATKWLSYAEVLRLKEVEEMVEVYYNSGQFAKTIAYLERCFASPFAMYESLGRYYREHGLDKVSHTRVRRYEILLEFAVCYDSGHEQQYRGLLTYDLYLRENMKSRPEFCGAAAASDQRVRRFYEQEAAAHRYLKGYEQYDQRQLRKMTHIERFSFDVAGDVSLGEYYLLFDYRNRNPLNHQAAVFCPVMPEEE